MWPLLVVLGVTAGPTVFEQVYDRLYAKPLPAEGASDATPGDAGRAAADGRPQGEGGDAAADSKRSRIRVSPEVLYRPPIAWPTIGLATSCLAGWVGSMYLFTTRSLGGWQAFTLSTLCTFASFTPMHDASHNSVSPRYRWLNDLVGLLCGVPLIFPSALFRYMHMSHHKHSNDSGDGPAGISLDPDRWAGEGPLALLPLRWATALLWYQYWAKKEYTYRTAVALRDGDSATLRSMRSLRDQCFAFWGAMFAFMLGLWYCRDVSVLICCILPALAASMYLMFLFDYVPHRPHQVPCKEDLYMSTSATKGFFGTVAELHAPTLGQNLHNIHHLFPQIPFYRYHVAWAAHEGELRARGTRVLPLLMWDRRRHLQELAAKDAKVA